MAQTGYTPIQLYYSTTASAVPTAGNLANGELAINITDGKLYYKSNGGVVTLLAGAGGAGIAAGSNTQVQFNSSGSFGASANLTWDGTNLTSTGFSGPHNGTVGATTPNTGSFTTLTTSSTVTINGGTANGVTYLNGSKVLTSGTALVFDGTNLGLGVTPSAWYSSAKAFQIGNGLSLWSSANTNAVLSQNLYLDASATYRWITANPATNFNQSNGAFSWQLADGTPSAGGAIGSFSTYMTLNSSGLLGIGTSSPAGFLDIQGTQTFSLLMTRFGAAANTALRRASGTQASPTVIANGDTIHQISFAGYDGVSAYQNAARISAFIDGATISATSMPGALYFGTTPSGSVTITERLRIASNGAWGLAGANYGTSGQVLTSNGSGSAPTWQNAGGGGSAATPTVLGTVYGRYDTTNNITFVGYNAGNASSSAAHNVSIGSNAMSAITTGSRNIVIGSSAAGALTTGEGNIVLGTYTPSSGTNTFSANTSGSSNVAIGCQALNSNTTANYNIAIGQAALTANTTGSPNLAIGLSALQANTTGANNVALGDNTLRNNTTANFNTAVGYQAAYTNTTGTFNVAVGASALYANTTGSDNIAIGGGSLYETNNGALYANTTGTANTAVGAGAMYKNTTGSNNTAVGNRVMITNTTGGYNTAVGGALDGTSLYKGALGANSTGNLNTAVGGGALAFNTTGSNNTGIGAYALLANTTGLSNTAVGYGALQSNTVSYGNVAIGTFALYSSNHTSDTDNYSVAVGYSALYSQTTGAANYAFGYDAARSITTAGAICAFGRDAFRSATAGTQCAFGYSAGRQLTTGTYNGFFGFDVASGATITGSQNNAFGYQSGYNLTSGTSNTFYGTYAGYAVTSGSNNLLLGPDAGRSGSPGGNFTTESNRIVLGNGSTTNAYIQVSWTVTSDARDKADVVDAKYGLDFIKGLRPVEYKWDKRSNYFKQNPDGTHKEAKTQLGFLAQDVIALEKQHGGVAKDLLIADDEKDEILSITETKMIPVLVKALQELNAKFDQLKAEHDAYVASHP
jgi:hypothetical protein